MGKIQDHSWGADNLVRAVEAAYENPFSVEKSLNKVTVAGVKQLQNQLITEKLLHRTAMQLVETAGFPIGPTESHSKALVRFNRLRFRPETNLAPDLSLDPSQNSSPSWDAMARGVLMSLRTALSGTEFVSQLYPLYQRSAFLEEATQMADQIRQQVAQNPALQAQLTELENSIVTESAAQIESWKKLGSSVIVEGIPLTEKLGVSLDNLGLLSQTLSSALLPVLFVSGSINIALEGKAAKKAYKNLKHFTEWQQAIALPTEEAKKLIMERLANPPKQRDEKQETMAIMVKKGLLALEQKKLEVEGHFLRRGFNSLVATLAAHLVELSGLLAMILIFGVASPFVGIPILASFLVCTAVLVISLYALKKYRPTLYQGLTFNAKLHISHLWNQLKMVWKEAVIQSKMKSLNKLATKTLQEVASLKALDKARLTIRKQKALKADPLTLDKLRKGAAEIKQLAKEHQHLEKRYTQLSEQIAKAKWKDFTLQAKIAEDSMDHLAKALRQIDHDNPHQAEITAQLKRMGIVRRTEAELKQFFSSNEKEITALARAR